MRNNPFILYFRGEKLHYCIGVQKVEDLKQLKRVLCFLLMKSNETIKKVCVISICV